jgi:hypothetical protein
MREAARFGENDARAQRRRLNGLSEEQAVDGDVTSNEASAPTAALDLSSDELEVVGEVFAQILSRIGVDGACIFSALRQGGSFADALALPRGVVELLYARAYRWTTIGRFDKAEALFHTLCLLDSLSADYRVGYGVCLKMSGRPEAAAAAFRAAHLCRPDWAIPHFHLADLALRCGRWPDASDALRAFEQAATPDLPAELVAQANRYRLALTLKEGQTIGAEPPP